jgi:hypothetical protein
MLEKQLRFDTSVITPENYKDWIHTINKLPAHIAHLVYRRAIGKEILTLDEGDRKEMLKTILTNTTTKQREDNFDRARCQYTK